MQLVKAHSMSGLPTETNYNCPEQHHPHASPPKQMVEEAKELGARKVSGRDYLNSTVPNPGLKHWVWLHWVWFENRHLFLGLNPFCARHGGSRRDTVHRLLEMKNLNMSTPPSAPLNRFLTLPARI